MLNTDGNLNSHISVTVSAVSSLVGPAHGLICCYLCWCDIFEQI